MHLFDYLDSGNGFKVRLLLAQLGMKYRWTNVDIDKGLTRTPEFLRKNPNGRIPTLELDDGTHLPESNAILWYLAEGSAFVPNDRGSFVYTPAYSPGRAVDIATTEHRPYFERLFDTCCVSELGTASPVALAVR